MKDWQIKELKKWCWKQAVDSANEISIPLLSDKSVVLSNRRFELIRDRAKVLYAWFGVPEAAAEIAWEDCRCGDISNHFSKPKSDVEDNTRDISLTPSLTPSHPGCLCNDAPKKPSGELRWLRWI